MNITVSDRARPVKDGRTTGESGCLGVLLSPMRSVLTLSVTIVSFKFEGISFHSDTRALLDFDYSV